MPRGRILRRLGARREPGFGEAAFQRTQIQTLEQRIRELESMLEGLQDAVHRENVRTNAELDKLRKRTEPDAIARALQKNARERGL